MAAIPVAQDFVRSAHRLGLDPDLLKLAGGEDYELLFTASSRVKIPKEIDGVSVTKIGKILPQRSGFRLIDSQGRRYTKEIDGFRHF
jgi:thiamine-monophosphate kinase